MDSDNDSYSENEFYYPDEENVLQENKNILNTSNDTSADEEMSTIQDSTVNGNRQLLPSFTHPSTISQRKFISVHFKMTRKATVSKFNCVF